MNFVRLDDWTVQLAIIASNGVWGGGEGGAVPFLIQQK